MTPPELAGYFSALPELPPFRLLGASDLPDPMPLLLDFYAADLHTYPPGYQVELPKLRDALMCFPQGFTLLQVSTPHGWLPAGYTAFHPIDPGPPRLPLPPLPLTPSTPLYIFNYSTHPRFHHTHLTRILLGNLARQLGQYPHHIKVAATVSTDGERVARRFGLQPQTTLSYAGQPWLWWESEQSDSLCP